MHKLHLKARHQHNNFIYHWCNLDGALHYGHGISSFLFFSFSLLFFCNLFALVISEWHGPFLMDMASSSCVLDPYNPDLQKRAVTWAYASSLMLAWRDPDLALLKPGRTWLCPARPKLWPCWMRPDQVTPNSIRIMAHTQSPHGSSHSKLQTYAHSSGWVLLDYISISFSFFT